MRGQVPTGSAEDLIISESSFRNARRAIEAGEPPSKKRKRESKGDSGTVSGPRAYKGPWAKYEEEAPEESSGSEEYEYVYEEDEIEPQPAAPTSKKGTAYEEDNDAAETTQFLGSQQYDYQGRTYMHVPQDLDVNLTGDRGDIKNYCPKKVIHTWKSHTKAITQLRFFPSSGHLLLSASADGKCLLYDAYHQRELLRSYSGHNKSISDIDFSPDGTSFLSASYSKDIKLWDTETGACISRFSPGATPHVVRINPSEPTQFLAGMSNKKILQFDTRADSRDPVQEYDHHLGPVNTITFCDNDRRFMTTSDDKSLRAWEWNIPVPIKFIAEPYMFSMNRAAAHPSGKYVAYQSMDNQIVVYASTEKFRQNRKKSFRGHNNAGYAIDLAVSPDGEILMSGDSAGKVCFWSWKTCKLLNDKTLQASDSPLVACAWHPRETSKIVTGDLNGVVKYWD